jgi:ATPase subunit of ABC transporter with duplicated ATPase domains
MADLDYGTLQVVPGNYDDYMLAAAQARERAQASNARAKERISDLQDFVRRFAANKSKARQATSRQKQIEKIKQDTVILKPSSRQNPFIRFEQKKKMHRLAVELDNISLAYGENKVIRDFSIMVEAGDKVGIVGANGMGKTTLLKLLARALEPTYGDVKWSENADLGYMAQDVSDEFNVPLNLREWTERFAQEGDDDQAIRGILGRLLFSNDEISKQVKVCSGGEKNRLVFGRLMLGRHNVLLLDEPTNHLDMESIESLQYALEKYEGTVFVVSHDRQFVSGIATRIFEMREDGITDYRGTYEEYRESLGLA